MTRGTYFDSISTYYQVGSGFFPMARQIVASFFMILLFCACGTEAPNSNSSERISSSSHVTSSSIASVSSNPSSSSGGDSDFVLPGSYELPPPDQCKNQYYVEGCVPGDATSKCGGLCTPPSAGHNEGKAGEPGYICPRYMLFSDQLEQAALDDAARYGWEIEGGEAPFTYAVVGHDNDGGILDEPDGRSVCCQCYQLIPYLPDEAQVIQNGESAVTLPKPLIVQAFNTGATPHSFDIFMGAGGIGAVNACMGPTQGFDPLYQQYPEVGQRWDGGVKPAGNPGNGTDCKTATNMVTEETLSSPGCVSWVEGHCNQIVHEQRWVTELTRRSCIQSNNVKSFYHLNWKVYAKRVACPEALTKVTGCRLKENKPSAATNTLTPDAAARDSRFKTGYKITTMQDCAKPTCAATDHVAGSGHTTDGDYNSFYACDHSGTPWTEPQ